MTGTLRPFVVEPPGAAAVADAAARAAAAHWSLPEPALLRRGMNALYAAGDEVVLRVSRPTAPPEAALWLAEHLAAVGLRVPRFVRREVVRDGPLAVFAVAREPSAGPVDWGVVGEMVARLHRLDIPPVAEHYPTPWCSSFPWWQFDELLADVRGELDEAALRGIDSALARHGAWRGAARHVVLCHGDVHPGNVLATDAGPMLIDWDLLCTGPPAWDHAPLMTWSERWGGEPGAYDAFAAGYGTSLRGDPTAEALAELRLLAATLLRLRAARSDPAAAEEAERRLRYWRGDADAPPWRAA